MHWIHTARPRYRLDRVITRSFQHFGHGCRNTATSHIALVQMLPGSHYSSDHKSSDPKFWKFFYPKKELSLVEMTIAFKGRSIIKQYNPKKPDKWGYKAFVLPEAKSGYMMDWSLYVGKDNAVPQVAPNISATHRIVRDLMVPGGKGHKLYTDSYYSGVHLALELGANETSVCGTVMQIDVACRMH